MHNRAINLENSYQSKILTIEDESYVRMSIKEYLEDCGFIVFESENGWDGLEIFKKEQPDLVLLDLRMPGMDGFQVLEKLKEISPDTPVIVASGTGNISAVEKALRMGAQGYILKPIKDMDILYQSVKKYIEESHLKKENQKYHDQLKKLVKERTRELEQSEQRYKAVFEHTGTAAIILDSDDTISMVNTQFADLVGVDRTEIEGKKKWYDFVLKKDIGMIQKHLHTLTKLDKTTYAPVQHELRFINRDGNKRYVYASFGMIPASDRTVVSLLDVTEKKCAEKRWKSLENQLRKSQKMEAIGTLAGGIAHDLNNILSPVLGYSDMIMQSSDPETSVYKRTKKIRQAAFRAADLVGQVLSYNRRNEGEKYQIRIHPILKEAIKLLKGSIPSTIEIVDRVDRDCGWVKADPTHIHQVIMNLCTNAYHAMEERGGTLTIGLTQARLSVTDLVKYPKLTGRQGEYLLIEVSDTGCGMDEDTQEHIFDPYFTTKEDGKGTGLGLATAYNIVKLCHGDIRVKSKVNHGTSFTILLPVVETQLKAPHQELNAQEATRLASGERLLAVDDDENIALLYKEGFELLGYEIDIFSSSGEALEFFMENHHQIDLVITDQTMPEKTGIEISSEMLAIKKDIPIILCSGYTGIVNEKKIKEAGIKKFIMKPVTVLDLSREIQKILRGKKQTGI